MIVHGNAKLGLAGRLTLVHSIEAGMSLKAGRGRSTTGLDAPQKEPTRRPSIPQIAQHGAARVLREALCEELFLRSAVTVNVSVLRRRDYDRHVRCSAPSLPSHGGALVADNLVARRGRRRTIFPWERE